MTSQQLQHNRLRIGQRIAQLREERGMTQQQIADLTGLKRPHIARLEKGTHSAGIDILTKVAAALGCEVNLV